jgi:threonylcarbamoyladenosine tRNA methylthiotransferase MtaB
VAADEAVDVCIFNSCTVTGVAAKKSRKAVRELRRRHPAATLVATGCHADMAPDEMHALGVDRVVTNLDKDRLAEILVAERLLAAAEPVPDGHRLVPAPGDLGHTRAFLKVQDGCDQRCTFCIVSTARGVGRSLAADAILAEIDELLEAGYNEVVLTGVHLGSYGHDRGERQGLARLVERILTTTALPRLRLSSLEPWDLAPSFFDLFADRRLQPHLHLPLQSGSDDILRRMARRTTTADFAALVAAARARVPGLAVSTDLIVGFPGESDRHFADTLACVAALGFSRLHVFRYSRRAGTRAATMSAQVPAAVLHERSHAALALAERLEAAFHASWQGTTAEVLWEEARQDGGRRLWSGYTGNYLRVETEAPAALDLHNRIEPVRLGTPIPGGLSAHRLAGDS